MRQAFIRATALAAVAALGVGRAEAATVALDAAARFSFSVVDVAFALPTDLAPVRGLDYELTITEFRDVEQRGAVTGPASADLSLTRSIGDTGGEGAVDVSARGESPGGQVDFTFGSVGAQIAMRQLGDFAIALTLEYVLESALAVEIDNPGAAVDRANAFGDVSASIVATGFDTEGSLLGILVEDVTSTFVTFSDLDPVESVNVDRSRGGDTRRRTFVNQSGLPRNTITFTASAGGQVLLGDSEPGVPPVAPIPLPAAGWMLLSGLGALAALRRARA